MQSIGDMAQTLVLRHNQTQLRSQVGTAWSRTLYWASPRTARRIWAVISPRWRRLIAR